MSTGTPELAKALADNPQISFVFIEHNAGKPTLVVVAEPGRSLEALSLPTPLDELPVRVVPGDHPKAMFLPIACIGTRNEWTACQNEPIKLGTQIQPRGQPWVGTAGAPCSWKLANDERRWGILSNWHVMVPSTPQTDWPIHQPTDQLPAIAALKVWSGPERTGQSDCDAALADARIQGKHTIDRSIIGIGPLKPQPAKAASGLQVEKSGRTSGLVHGQCVGVNAAARVDYGNFTAQMIGLDVFRGTNQSMSLPGDSGSLIVTEKTHHPVSLLFAGDSTYTMAIPIDIVVNRFSLSFQL